MNIYVGNLPHAVNDKQLEDKFKEVTGIDVTNVKIIKDRETGESRGFGFLDIENNEDAKRAIDAMNGYDFDGRRLVVNEARGPQQRTDRAGGSGFRSNSRFGGPRRDSNGNNGGGFRRPRF